MDFDTYQQFALSLANRKDNDYDLQHAAMGMITETGELVDNYKRRVVYGKKLDIINLTEEIGDCMWYAALAYDVLHQPMEWTLVEEVKEAIDLPEFEQLTMLNAASTVFSGGVVMKEPPDELLAWLNNFMGMLQIYADRHIITLQQAAEANIAKLRKRFPNGFTQHAALNRDTDAEMAAIEEVKAA